MVARRSLLVALPTLVVFFSTVLAGAHLAAQTLIVSPKGGSLTVPPNSAGQSASFTLTGLVSGVTYTLEWYCSGTALSCTSPLGYSIIGSAYGASVPINFNSGSPGPGRVRLTAYGNGSSDSGWFNVTAATFGVSVTPKGGTAATRTANTGGYSGSFTVQNTGSASNTYSFSCSGAGGVTCGTVPAAVTLAANGQTTVSMPYSVGAPGTGTLSLTASGTNASDQGSYSVPIVSYGVAVTPKGGTTATRTANTGGYSESFTVQNTGSASNTYSFSCGGAGGVTCGTVPAAVTLAANGQTTVSMPYSVGAAGTGTLSLTASGTNAGDAGSYSVPIVSYGVAVTPKGGTTATRTANTGGYSESFTVQNTGSASNTYSFSCGGAGGVTCGTVPAAVTLAANGQTTVSMPYSVQGAGTGTLSLTASGTNASDAGSYSVPVVGYGVAVTPKGATTANRLANTGGYADTFRVTNTGSASNTYSVTCSGSANVTCNGVSAASVTLNAGASTIDTARYSVGAVGTGTLTLSASGPNATDAGSDSVPVVSTVPQPPVVDVTSVNPGVATKRGVCLTIAMGAAAAAECGDLRMVHPLPTTRTLNKARTPTLLYNSQTAHPYPLIAANVTLPVTAVVPDSVTGTVTISAVIRARGKWVGSEWTPGATRRVVLGFDGLGDATGINSYTLEIRNWYPSPTPSQPTTVTGQVVIVNRSGSPFGAGWWLAGLEQLNVGTKVWVGGDGSVRQYQVVTGQTNMWVAPSLDYPDTLKQDASGNYVRYDRDSVRVKFDPTGLHIATINRQGHTTTFAYPGGNLGSITLPTASVAKVYQFNYDTNSKLQSVAAPGPDGVTARTTNVTVTSGRLASIQDPDLTSVSFTYDPSILNRITSRTDRRGTVTTYGFDGGNKLAQASINMGGGQAPIVRSVTALESRGLSGSGTPSSVDTAIAYAKFSGPRNVGDTTLFWLNRFGAPRKIVDALGNATRLTRGDPRWPVLVTRVQYPTGQIIGAVYDTLRGNVLSTTDSIVNSQPGPPSTATATTSYVWDPKWDGVRKFTRPVGDSVVASYDPATGNMLWQQDGRGSVSQVSFGYNSANQVVSVTLPNTPARQIRYDALGNLDTTTTPMGYLTLYQNDSVGRPTVISSPLDSAVGSTRRQVEQLFYDSADRDTLTITAGPAMSSSVLAESVLVRKFYNRNGQLDSLSRSSKPDVRNVGVITTRWKYDMASRVIAEIAPDGMPDSMFYDPAGNDTLEVTRLGLRIGMAYDALNHLSTRRLPVYSYPQRPSGISVLGGGMPNYYAAYQILADTQTFTYDPMGRILTANNGDAKVKRSYYTDGLLQSDSLWIRTLQGTDFTQHAYGITNSYDLDGGRVGLNVPWQLPPSFGPGDIMFKREYASGALIGVLQYRTWGIGCGASCITKDSIGFGYSARGDLASINWDSTYAQYTEQFSYDADGRLATDTIRNLGGTAYPRYVADPIRAIRYAYDGRENMTSGTDPIQFKDTLTMSYSGLGHLVQLNLAQHTPCTGRYTAAETFSYDGLGNRAHATTVHTDSVPYCNESFDSSGSGSEYIPGTGRLLHDTLGGSSSGVTTYTHDAAGAVVFSQNLGAPAEERATYYAADGKVRAVDWRRGAGPAVHFGFWARAIDEYRYDALGRRIWTRSQKSCNDGGTLSVFQATECQTSVLRRVIWDQDQVLAEIQMPDSARYQENDTAAVVLDTIPAGPGKGDPSRYFGRVVYAHALGVDHPVSVTRLNYVYAIDLAGTSVSPPAVVPWVRIMPFWNAVGDAALGAFTTGARLYCTPTTSTTACVGVVWPYLFAAYDREHGMTRDNWHGSLLESGRDKSGLQFRRNRYYDPQTGRFTQEDPLGLAGGLNLYGFAKGDPVNFSDPFGLCPIPPDDCPRDQQFIMMMGARLQGLPRATAEFGALSVVGGAVGAVGSALFGSGEAITTLGLRAAPAAARIGLLAPPGAKLAQMIGRWGGSGGRDAFMQFAQDFAGQAQRAGNVVTGKVGPWVDATVYRVGNSYMVADAGGVIRSYVQNARPAVGIAKVFEELAH